MEDLSLHILDIAENSTTAGAKNIEIIITENNENDLLKIEIIDDGKGMTPDQTQKATDPFFTSRTTRRVGLGLSLLNQAAQMANGLMEIQSIKGKGTRVSATFQLSHVDRQPLGNMADTIIALIIANPNINIVYKYERDDHKFVLDTREIKEKIKGININSTSVISFVRQYIKENTESFS
ncbi:MAG: ATP-binding protein [Chlorobiaceae bacterium]|nr:ATP-binding protein [Chlorobiaceae bacterium]